MASPLFRDSTSVIVGDPLPRSVCSVHDEMGPQSWLPIPPTSPFSLANIPFGIVTTPLGSRPVPAIAIGDHVLDLAAFASGGGFDHLDTIQQHLFVFTETTLNAFAGLGRPVHRQVRKYLQDVFRQDTTYGHVLRDNADLSRKCLFPLKETQSHMPLRIGDFSDFYGGLNHAVNAGALFRGQNGALLPNYLHLPMAYHGRASSIVPSGTPIQRPCGQVVHDLNATPKAPVFTACQSMDFELELGAFVCHENPMGQRISIDDAENALFGFVLVNDWSARDIQRWEYVPLGPFNGKNFATSISPWVVLADALEPFRCKGLENKEQLLPYLVEKRSDTVYNLHLEVDLTNPKTGVTSTLCRTNAAEGLVWSFTQMLAHHTITGCPMKVGDLLGSGTISGLTKDSLGCLLEQTLNGKEGIKLDDGEQRTWLQDGDIVTLRGWAGDSNSGLVGFGECVGQLLPADKASG